MSAHKESTWYIYGFAITLSLLLAALVGWKLGAASLFTVLVLAGIEISFSFENAIINAKILQRMSPLWQKLFMTVGIVVAVFGVRVLVPFIMVAATAKLGVGQVIDLSLHKPEEYARHLTHAHPIIAAFGGMFLLMIFLDFIFETRPVVWLAPIERRLARFGKLESLSVVVALATLLFASRIFAPAGQANTVLQAGIIGMFIYLVINTLESAQRLAGEENHVIPQRLIKGGVIGFLYLEMIDASFSLDGVIGAFAITTDIVLITVGLAIGALFVRAMTIHLLRRGTLQRYRYLDHGAHYAIGLLALLLLLSIRYELPQAITGLSGVAIISVAIIHSYREAKHETKAVTVV